jgi:CheY-like chemotaxis protein
MATPLAVLIVEDLESDAALIMRLLARAGYDVTFARVETPSELRAALQARAWDIVISDYSLPELDGPTALAIVKSSGLDLPFIMVSGTR